MSEWKQQSARPRWATVCLIVVFALVALGEVWGYCHFEHVRWDDMTAWWR
jgi:hypothetical protein